ncbi:MAG: alpha/beta fold hydrolase [Polyangiaceae bacterium]|nr:alpha/beta fold hydrolase [Polyangiaceae bacterium]NUQ73344.1 alpha/beta fold hydrolase [Polyangiaceae bacterium]
MAQRKQFQSGSLAVNGTDFHYEAAGEGDFVILIHAGIADLRMWDEQFDEFASHYRVIRYDRRGFGKTPMVAGEFSHHEDLFGVLTALGVSRAHLVGCSQGGKTAIDFTLAHPEMTSALVLVASALSGFDFQGEEPAQFAAIEEAAARGDVDAVNELELQIWVDGPGQPPNRVEPKIRELVRAMNKIALSAPEIGVERPLDPPAAERLSEIRAPAFVITGDLDTPHALAAADHLSTRAAKRAVMVGTAHLPNMERPAEFNALVLGFLSSITAG